jgi:hypothetical protein
LNVSDIQLASLDRQSIRLQLGSRGDSFGKVARSEYDTDPLLPKLPA